MHSPFRNKHLFVFIAGFVCDVWMSHLSICLYSYLSSVLYWVEKEGRNGYYVTHGLQCCHRVELGELMMEESDSHLYIICPQWWATRGDSTVDKGKISYHVFSPNVSQDIGWSPWDRKPNGGSREILVPKTAVSWSASRTRGVCVCPEMKKVETKLGVLTGWGCEGTWHVAYLSLLAWGWPLKGQTPTRQTICSNSVFIKGIWNHLMNSAHVPLIWWLC